MIESPRTPKNKSLSLYPLIALTFPAPIHPHTKVSNIMLADHVDVDIRHIIVQQVLQLLLYLLHLLLVAQRLEDVHRPLQVHPSVTDLETDVDRSQELESAGELEGLAKDFLF